MSKASQKQLETKEDKSVVKKVKNNTIEKSSTKETKDYILFIAELGFEADSIVKKLSEERSKIEPDKKKSDSLLEQGMIAYGIETNYPLINGVASKHVPFLFTFAKQLKEEYNCKTPSELALVQLAALAHTKVFELTERLHAYLNDPHLSPAINGRCSIICKELDRAKRQLMTALTMLRQLKNPSIELNITAKTAFVSQNQQINTTSEDPKTPNHPSDEIIDQQ